MTTHTEKIIRRLRDERGLGDRVVLAHAAADELERLLAELQRLVKPPGGAA